MREEGWFGLVVGKKPTFSISLFPTSGCSLVEMHFHFFNFHQIFYFSHSHHPYNKERVWVKWAYQPAASLSSVVLSYAWDSGFSSEIQNSDSPYNNYNYIEDSDKCNRAFSWLALKNLGSDLWLTEVRRRARRRRDRHPSIPRKLTLLFYRIIFLKNPDSVQLDGQNRNLNFGFLYFYPIFRFYPIR